MIKMKKIIIISILAILFIGTFVFLWGKSQPEVIEYEELKPTIGTISKNTIVTGKLEPRNEVNVKPQISGIITEILKAPGHKVNQGDVIAKIKVIPDMAQLSSAESRVRLAEINLKQVETDYKRDENLYNQKLISANDFDKISQQLKQAIEEKAAAEDALQVVRDGVSKSNASASSTLIRATIAGVILDIPVKVGNSVINSNSFNDGTTIATIANMNDLIFRGNIDETEVGQLTEGMPMKITIGALQDMTLDAVLEYISPKAIENNGANQFEIKAAVRLSGETKIRAGYSANAEIVLSEVKNVITVPESVLEFEGDSTFVLIPDGTKTDGTKNYQRQSVTTGLSDGVNIEIKSGIDTTATVRGQQIIKD
ncbi:MAG: efflux RND transporter periplasmic adaptor subunit [Bacteroidales bacterium]|nr:efflux RND transporter periplasmic adaptor subunit [Bacteroidales bacterium]